MIALSNETRWSSSSTCSAIDASRFGGYGEAIQSFADQDTERLRNRERVRSINSAEALPTCVFVEASGVADSSGKPDRVVEGRSAGSVQHSNQRPVADLFSVERGSARGGRDR